MLKTDRNNRFRISEILTPFFVGFFALVFALVAFRGASSLDSYNNSLSTKVGGPFEASNSTSRYALVQAIIENHTFNFSSNMASFAAPDVVSYKGTYFSVFTPGVSFVDVPFYILGQKMGLAQPGAYLMNTFFAVLDVILVFLLTKRLTKSATAAGVAGLIFILATNSLAFSGTLTQHLLTSFLLLLMFLNSSYLIAGAVFGLGILTDIPNAIIFLPALINLMIKAFKQTIGRKEIQIKLSLKPLLFAVGILPFLLAFGYYNFATAGSPLKLAQFIGRTENIKQDVQTYLDSKLDAPEVDNYSVDLPFNTRRLLNGLYILLISDERGIIFYYPIVILGFVGLYLAYKNQETRSTAVTSLATVGLIVLTYGMFGDPWGGWSFGARYMIPANAILSVFVGYGFWKYYKKIWYFASFAFLLIYSLYVSNLGALTTAAVPPKGEALHLPDPVPYTPKYNLIYLNNNQSSSYVYNAFFKTTISLTDFLYIIVGAEIIIFSVFYLAHIYENRKLES